MTYIHMTKDGTEVFLAHQIYETKPYEISEDLTIEVLFFVGYRLEHPRDIHNGYVVTAEALDKKSVRIGEL